MTGIWLWLSASQNRIQDRKALGSVSAHFFLQFLHLPAPFRWTCVCTRQVILWLLTTSNLHFAVRAYGMGEEGQKILSHTWPLLDFYSGFQWLARMATQRKGLLWPKCFIGLKFSSKYMWLLLQWCLLMQLSSVLPWNSRSASLISISSRV